MNVLFVCSRNQWRSPTAEKIFRNTPGINVRSAGLSSKSPRKLSQKDLDWADVVFAMEKKHQSRIKEAFSAFPLIYVLDIPDQYEYMDDALIEILQQEVPPYLDSLSKM